ncbi:MAG: hypothetical protein F6K09_21115 [Merismopedia sp. SIO2A8]|nr:hypothetical protein [Merismopedia sp. SIO2A8]
MNYLTFANDHDVRTPNASSQFRNIRLSEEPSSSLLGPTPSNSAHPLPINHPTSGDLSELGVSLNQKSTSSPSLSRGRTQARITQMTVSPNQKILNLKGNREKKLVIKNQVTPETSMKVEFRSNTKGTIQGIGFDIDQHLSQNRLFKFMGTQKWGNVELGNDGMNSGWQTDAIELSNDFIGTMENLAVVNDQDIRNPNVVSEFSHIALFERTPGSLEAQDPSQTILALDPQQSQVLVSTTESYL